MKNKHFLFIFGALVITIIIYTIWRNSRIKSIENKYFENVNFSFRGVVVAANRYTGYSETDKKLQPARGTKFNIYYLEKLSSTIKEYDPRDSTSEFYCLIKKDEIVIIESAERKNIEGNDIIEFNGIVDSVYHYKKVYKKKSGKGYIDTVLYNQWRPTDIFWEGHRRNLVREILKQVPR